MGILSGPKIDKEVGLGNITIEPYDRRQLNPNSYDVLLAPEIKMYSKHREGRAIDYLDMGLVNETETHLMHGSGMVLRPGRVYLGSTVERIASHRYVTFLEGKSSLARLGLSVHITGGFIDVGFDGNLTLEMSVEQPLKIYPLKRVAQLCYAEVVGDVVLYTGKYQGQIGAQASRSWLDFDHDDPSPDEDNDMTVPGRRRRQPARPVVDHDGANRSDTPVAEMDLSVRVVNTLERQGIILAGQLLDRTREQLLEIPNFGAKTLEEVCHAVAALGVVPPWQQRPKKK